MAENNPEVIYHIRRCMLEIDKKVEDAKKDLEEFMETSLKWSNELKSILDNKLAAVENTTKKKQYKVSSMVSSLIVNGENETYNITNNEKNIINIAEANFHIGNESISCRTRGALKALQASVVSGNVTDNKNEPQRTRGRSRTRRTKQSETVVAKRTAEDGTLGIDIISKKIKKEKLSVMDATKISEDEIFKKPKPRGRQPKKAKQSESMSGVTNDVQSERPITFNEVLHSSPNGYAGENTFLVSPKNLSVIPKSPLNQAVNMSPKEQVEQPTTPTSTNFISDGEGKSPNLDRKLTNEIDIEQTSNRKSMTRRSRRKSKESNKNLDEIRETNSSKSSINEKIVIGITDSTYSVNSIKNPDLNNKKKSEKIDSKSGIKLEKTLVDGNNSSESSRNGSLKRANRSRAESERILRETRSDKADLDTDSSKVEPLPTNNENVTQPEELNNTKVVRKATKRTKPVLKSRIFDSKGNIQPLATAEKNVINATSPDKPYSLRSSSFNREIVIKKENVSTDENDGKSLSEIKESCIRRSNVENEPEKKTKCRTKTKKPAYDSDTVRITRTKSKESKVSTDETSFKKPGLTELARKSLNKAKLISLQKDQPKIKRPLVNRLAFQKGQACPSKMPLSTLKEDILGSSNKMNTLLPKNNIVNLGSQVKLAKVPTSVKKNENLILTGKGKYLNLFTDVKDKYITPAKRCLSPDVMIKSTSKTTKEEELEKELKLKALKEKEEEALMKREMAIKMKQKELKEKNEKKLELATKQRKKLEMEKYNCKVQLEKEKEEKRRLLLEEREMMKKEKAKLKRELMEQKLAETEERRRLEEEARIAKLKEQEAEQQRLMLEKQKELERHEKRAQERLAEQKARENYEMMLKTEQMLREKQQQLASQFQSANKAAAAGKANPVNKHWKYKPRNENDCGLDDEESDLDSQSDSEQRTEKKVPVPKWAQRVMSEDKGNLVKCIIKKEAMMEYMKCHQKTPDIQKMFKMTPSKRIKRTSSAIWNTPSS